MKPRIIVVGSSSIDHTLRFERIPRPGETLLSDEYTTAAGGKGANQAVAAARAGGAVKFIGRLGPDAAGGQIIAGFRRDRIDVAHVLRDRPVPSGVALIFLSKHGENAIGVAPNANGQLRPADVREARDAFVGASAVVLQLEIPLATVVAAAALATRHAVRVILNPAPARPLPDSLLRQVSILTPNETEATELTGIKVTTLASAARAARILQTRGVATVIITLGKRGAFVADADGGKLVPGFQVKPVDTVAAGDVFNGALAVALGEGCALHDAVRFANAAAAISVTRPGAQPSAPLRSEIETFMKAAGAARAF